MKKILHQLISAKFIAATLFAVLAVPATAQTTTDYFDFADHDFTYKIIRDNEVSIVSDPLTSNIDRYVGDIVIPDEVSHDGVTYKVTEIADATFNLASLITSVTLGNNIRKIGLVAFCNCTGITEMIFPESVRTVGMAAFLGCENLSFVKLNEGLETLQGGSFSGCGLTEITIPSTVTKIENGVFGLNYDLEEIIVAEGNTRFSVADGVLYSSDLSTLYCYPGGKADEEFTIPSTTTTIYENAFEGAGLLKSVAIPESISTYGSAVFYECPQLNDVYALNPKPVSLPNESVFETNITNRATLHVPTGSVDAYKNNEYWQKFVSIIPIGEIEVSEIKLNASTLLMEYGDQFQLEATVLPDNAYDKTILWSTTNEYVADVTDEGLVQAFENGTASIICSTPNGSVKASCLVTVSDDISVAGVNAESLDFRVEGSSINILSDTEVEIYDAAGCTVYAGTRGSVALPSGFYILRAEGKAFKIVL